MAHVPASASSTASLHLYPQAPGDLSWSRSGSMWTQHGEIQVQSPSRALCSALPRDPFYTGYFFMAVIKIPDTNNLANLEDLFGS